MVGKIEDYIVRDLIHQNTPLSDIYLLSMCTHNEYQEDQATYTSKVERKSFPGMERLYNLSLKRQLEGKQLREKISKEHEMRNNQKKPLPQKKRRKEVISKNEHAYHQGMAERYSCPQQSPKIVVCDSPNSLQSSTLSHKPSLDRHLHLYIAATHYFVEVQLLKK